MPIVRTCAFAVAALVSAATLGGCKAEITTGCVLGPCGPPSVGNTLSLVGFPQARVDRNTVVGDGYRGTLRVGETVTLYLVKSLGPGAPTADTIRTNVTWALSDSAAARVTGGPQGAGVITAIAAGSVGQVLVNGTRYEVISCFGPFGGCDRVKEVVVLP